MTDSINQTSTRIGDQIKAYEDHAKQQKAMSLRRDIEKRCQAVGVDPNKIEENPKWFNQTASYAVFENEVQAQIENLVKEKEQLAESITIVKERAKELGLAYQHWAELLEHTNLSSVLSQMSSYADDIKAETERNEKAKKEKQAHIVNMNGKAVDKTTGEIVDDYISALLIFDNYKIKLSASRYQFKQLWQYMKDMGIKRERVIDSRRDAQ